MSLPVLWVVDGVVVVYAGLLLNDLRLGAAARHGATQEDVDQQHHAKQDPEGDAEVGEPGRVDLSVAAAEAGRQGGAGRGQEHRRRRSHRVRSLNGKG